MQKPQHIGTRRAVQGVLNIPGMRNLADVKSDDGCCAAYAACPIGQLLVKIVVQILIAGRGRLFELFTLRSALHICRQRS